MLVALLDNAFKYTPEDGVVTLRPAEMRPADPVRGRAPTYDFNIFAADADGNEVCVGGADMCIGYSELYYYGGNIGYEIDDEFRGHGYAGRACLLLKKVMSAHGMTHVHIAAEPDNPASLRVCEKIGARFVREADIPEDSDLYRQGLRRVSIFDLACGEER